MYRTTLPTFAGSVIRISTTVRRAAGTERNAGRRLTTPFLLGLNFSATYGRPWVLRLTFRLRPRQRPRPSPTRNVDHPRLSAIAKVVLSPTVLIDDVMRTIASTLSQSSSIFYRDVDRARTDVLVRVVAVGQRQVSVPVGIGDRHWIDRHSGSIPQARRLPARSVALSRSVYVPSRDGSRPSSRAARTALGPGHRPTPARPRAAAVVEDHDVPSRRQPRPRRPIDAGRARRRRVLDEPEHLRRASGSPCPPGRSRSRAPASSVSGTLTVIPGSANCAAEPCASRQPEQSEVASELHRRPDLGRARHDRRVGAWPSKPGVATANRRQAAPRCPRGRRTRRRAVG